MSISEISEQSKLFLLRLARKSIADYLEGMQEPKVTEKVPKELLNDHGTFVTLTINGELRGCIGSIMPRQAIYKDVIENAQAAAFRDPRFPPLKPEELTQISIEISILSLAKKYPYKTAIELLGKIKEDHPGVILRKGMRSATFLPQVWEQLPDAEDFLMHLCMKAGLPPDAWNDEGDPVNIELYTVESFSET
ncbi:MAG: AmmeMemoRadiSam system protein A [Nanoarchaeota archaeon]